MKNKETLICECGHHTDEHSYPYPDRDTMDLK